MITGTVVNSYPKNGKTQFVFKLSGPSEELEQYLAIQRAKRPSATFIDPVDKAPLYWSSTPSGDVIRLKITTKGNIVEDTTISDLRAVSQAKHDFVYEQAKASFAERAQRAGRVRVAENLDPEPETESTNQSID